MSSHTTLYNSDESLANALQGANQAAFGILYDRYSPILFRVLQKMTPDMATAEEALKVCFISIWQNKHSYNPSEERLFIWMFRTAISITNTMLEKNQITVNYVGNDNSTYTDWKNAKLIMELFLSGQISQEEAGEKMNIPISELRQLLRKEINQLRRI